MAMGEHDLANIIFDCTAPCGAVLISATDALVYGADATAVVCLVRETINGRNKTDRAALFQGQGSPGTTFNATRALCTVLDKKSRREQKVHEEKLHAGKVDGNPSSMHVWATREHNVIGGRQQKR